MSTTLDTNNFFKNKNPNGDAFETKIVFPRKVENIIYEDFEGLLNGEENENIIKLNASHNDLATSFNFDDSSSSVKNFKSWPITHASNDKLSSFDALQQKTTNTTNVSSSQEPQFSLITADESHSFSDSLHCCEDQQLLLVENDDFKPIVSPFMVPGIYKKVPLSTVGEQGNSQKTCKPRNVFISTVKLNGGCIVQASEFHTNYVIMTGEAVNKSDGESADQVQKNSVLMEKNSDFLEVLAYKILKDATHDKVIIDRKRNEVIQYEGNINRKRIHRFLTPENLKLMHGSKKNPVQYGAAQSDIKSEVKTKRGRPRKQDKLKIAVKNPHNESDDKPIKGNTNSKVRTRYGRLIKTRGSSLSPIVNNQKADCDNTIHAMRTLLQDLRDTDYRCSDKAQTPISPIPCPDVIEVPKRTPPSKYICPTCNKIFLGRRLQRHYVAHPDHLKIQKEENSSVISDPATVVSTAEAPELSLFKFLVQKLQNSQLPEDQRTDLFLNEISDFVEQIQSRSSRLIRNTSGLHFLSKCSAKILGVPEGHYSFDINALEAPPDPPCILHFENIGPQTTVATRSLDYNLSMSLDDTLTDTKLALSDTNMILPSEESLLRTVDDLVTEKMKKLNEEHADILCNGVHKSTAGSENNVNQNKKPVTVIHYDHANDNAVEAVSMKVTQPPPLLDLSLDLFQFNSN